MEPNFPAPISPMRIGPLAAIRRASRLERFIDFPLAQNGPLDQADRRRRGRRLFCRPRGAKAAEALPHVELSSDSFGLSRPARKLGPLDSRNNPEFRAD